VLLVFVDLIVVLKMNSSLLSAYNDFKCSLGIISNDLLEGGNYNNGTTEFLGLKSYLVLFESFMQNITNSNRTIQQNLTNVSKPMRAAAQQIDLMSSLNEKIPNDSTN
jgi:hypothetical protein